MTCDVIVIGTGQAGVPLATRLAGAGRRVLLLERGPVGGTCVNVGCTPTKTMIASARAAHVVRTAARLGVRAGRVRVDFPAVVARKDAIVRQWREGSEGRIDRAGPNLTLVRGQARFVGPRRVEVAGEVHEAATVIVNTGARPVVPALPGLDSVPWVDSAGALALPALPRHLAIVGGGYIGCELGQMFRRFGSRVTIVHRGRHLLDREDEDVSRALEEVFEGEGIELRLGVEPRAVAADPSGIRLALSRGRAVRASHLLVAVGRAPDTADLGVAAAGIRLDRRGAIEVDEHFATSAPGVYAVGDVIGGPQFTHNAWDDHRLLYEHLQGRPARARTSRIVPYVVFTDPQVARVGLSERAARERGIACQVATLPFAAVARAIELDETAGTMKLLVDPSDGRILGATLVGIEAGELLHIFVNLMAAGAPAGTLVDVQHVHPTLAEGVQSLVRNLPRYALAQDG